MSCKIEGSVISVKGPKGELRQELLPLVKIEADEKEIWVKSNEEVAIRKSDYRDWLSMPVLSGRSATT